jgi:hypothetical protein
VSLQRLQRFQRLYFSTSFRGSALQSSLATKRSNESLESAIVSPEPKRRRLAAIQLESLRIHLSEGILTVEELESFVNEIKASRALETETSLDVFEEFAVDENHMFDDTLEAPVDNGDLMDDVESLFNTSNNEPVIPPSTTIIPQQISPEKSPRPESTSNSTSEMDIRRTIDPRLLQNQASPTPCTSPSPQVESSLSRRRVRKVIESDSESLDAHASDDEYIGMHEEWKGIKGDSDVGELLDIAQNNQVLFDVNSIPSFWPAQLERKNGDDGTGGDCGDGKDGGGDGDGRAAGNDGDDRAHDDNSFIEVAQATPPPPDDYLLAESDDENDRFRKTLYSSRFLLID